MLVRLLLCVLALLIGRCPAQTAGSGTKGEGEWFEREVRPVLMRRCARCHGPRRQRSGLRIDHLQHLLRGGDRGAAVVPGDAGRSRLIAAVTRTGATPAMPPRVPLPDAEVAILRRWIDDGAFWPDEPVTAGGGAAHAEPFDLSRRAKFWCWQPPIAVDPPRVGDGWARGAIDRFVFARLRAAGLLPAPDADAYTWLRRVHLDLTGLPPGPQEIAAFVRDPSMAARERVVDTLLASPQFGERWARHWFDLVGYAETYGHELDFDIHGAWRYRDQVIRAFNADVPYDRIVREHIAGDLLPEPRRDPATGHDESLLATAFFWFGSQKHSPVDPVAERAVRVDRQIDVLSKAFLGVTVSCARCHDHKFDAITQRDYYALAGMLRSSRFVQAPLVPVSASCDQHEHLAELAGQWHRAERAAWPRSLADVERYLLVLIDALETPQADIDALADATGLHAGRLGAWWAALHDPSLTEGGQAPLGAFVQLARTAPADLAGRSAVLLGASPAASKAIVDGVVLGDAATGFAGWLRTGSAFAAPPVTPGETCIADGGRLRVQVLPGTWLHSGATSPRLQGVLQSPTFTVDHRYLHVRAAGRGARINVIIEGHTLVRAPIYGTLKQLVDEPAPRWYVFDLDAWRGREAYVELVDLAAPDPADEKRAKGYGDDGWIAVQRALVADDRPATAERGAVLLGTDVVPDHATLARRFGAAVSAAVALWTDRPERLEPSAAALLDGLSRHGVLGDARERRAVLQRPVAALHEEFRAVEAAIEVAAVAPAMAEGTPRDAPLFVRGNPSEPGPPVPRRPLEVLGGAAMPAPQGSGRRALAAWIASAENPLTARVFVNRLWHHLFGRGIVATVDNFGVLGARPSHPDLLDWLARRFVADGWSIKRAVRAMVLSRSYGVSSVPVGEASTTDPDNRWLHRARVRRLPGEILRDAMLAVSGRLNRTMFGPPVPIHLTPFLRGRGRPKSGPPDGDGRRSVYLAVRRNFLDPLMLVFDTPQPFSTVGRRNASNVPAQSLALRNGVLIAELSGRWGRRLAASTEMPRQRVAGMFLAAFGRPATTAEIEAALAFVLEQAHAHGGERVAEARQRAWSDLAQVLFNAKEFRHVR